MNSIAQLGNPALREVLEAIKAELRSIAGEDARLIIYGSWARGEERKDSDVDLIVVLPDEKATFENEDRVRDVIYEYADRTDFFLSVMVVSMSQMRRYSGFMAFDGVEKEGIAV